MAPDAAAALPLSCFNQTRALKAPLHAAPGFRAWEHMLEAVSGLGNGFQVLVVVQCRAGWNKTQEQRATVTLRARGTQ